MLFIQYECGDMHGLIHDVEIAQNGNAIIRNQIINCVLVQFERLNITIFQNKHLACIKHNISLLLNRFDGLMLHLSVIDDSANYIAIVVEYLPK